MLALAPAAHAATVSVEGTVLRVSAAPGEANQLTVAEGVPNPSFTVTDPGAALTAGPGCAVAQDGSATCSVPVSLIDIDAGDLDDSVTVAGVLPARILGGEGDDRLQGGDGSDELLGDAGSDFADGGDGHDTIDMRDGVADSVWCGAGRDGVLAEMLDALDLGCESVDYGPPGRVGRLMAITGGGRWVPIPGQTWARVDRRILADVLYMIRRYRVRITEGFGTVGHEPFGEHPLGLAVDIAPGPGGTWAGRVPARALGRAAPEPPAPPIPLGRLERRLQPRPPVDMQALARLRAAPAPVLGALADSPAAPGEDRLGLRDSLNDALIDRLSCLKHRYGAQSRTV